MTTEKKPVSRRRFLKSALQAGGAVAAPHIVPGSALGLGGATPPSDRISLAGLGIGSRGARDLESFLSQKDVQFRAIRDVRNERREAIKSRADKHHGNNDCAMYSDMNDLWARDDIDAVLIATGDRWHTLLSIMTAKSGKDVYCEKPCSMTVRQSRALADAYQRLGRIYQAGTQRRSGSNFQYVIDLAKIGKLGKLHTLHANVGRGTAGPRKPPTTGCPPSPCRPSKSSTGIAGGDPALGALTIRSTCRAAGAATSISTAAGFLSGAHTPLICASGSPTPMKPRRSNSIRAASMSTRRTRSYAATPTGSSW